MNPGRALDALVGEQIMGWKPPSQNSLEQSKPLPHYSTDIAAASEVKLKVGIDPITNDGLGKVLAHYDQNGGYAVGESEAHAICLAALKSIGIESGWVSVR